MQNKVLTNEVLSTIKVDKTNVSNVLNNILSNVKSNKGRKSFEEMNDFELYSKYVKNCEAEGKAPLPFVRTVIINGESRRVGWLALNELYSFDELLSTDELERNDSRFCKLSEAELKGYIGDELDYEAIDILYSILFKALKSRLVMLLNLENVPSLINNAYKARFNECNVNIINIQLNSKISEIEKVLKDKEVSEWLKTGVTDLSLCDENNLIDYISTYQKVLRQLTDIRGENLKYMRSIIHNEFDVFEDEIISNDIPDIETLFEDNDSDDLEDILNLELSEANY